MCRAEGSPMRRDLVQRAMTHDHEVFSELAGLSIDKLYAIARLILHDTERARDATQEALVLAWRDIAALRDPDRFDGWLTASSSTRAIARRAVTVRRLSSPPSLVLGSGRRIAARGAASLA